MFKVAPAEDFARMKMCPEWKKGFCGGKKGSKCHFLLLWRGAALGLLLLLLAVIAVGQVDGATAASSDPYKILGIQKHATLQDIRKAYKQLAKEWWV